MLLFYIHNCSITSLKSWIISNCKHPHTQRHLNVPEITVITDATQQIRGVLRGNDIDPEACVSIPLSHTADFRSSSMVSAGLLFLSIITSKFNRYWQLFVSDGKLIRDMVVLPVCVLYIFPLFPIRSKLSGWGYGGGQNIPIHLYL